MQNQPDGGANARARVLMQAMASLLAVTPGDLIQRHTLQTRRLARGKPQSRWHGGMHCHPYPEICIPITDGAAMDFVDGRVDLAPPALVILEPNAMHCEAYRAKSSGYLILWMSISESSVIAIASTYTPRKGWASVHHWGVRHNCGRHLFRHLTASESSKHTALDQVRADMLVLLGVMLRQSLRQDKTPGRRPARSDAHDDVLTRIKAFIDNHYRDLITLPQLAASAGLTPNYLNALFRQRYGEPIHAYIVRKRMQTAMALLKQSDLLIKQVALRSGFEDPLYFSRAFRRHHGISPGEVRQTMDAT